MVTALNSFIKNRTGTTRNLTPTNESYLKKKFSFLFPRYGGEIVNRKDFEEKENKQRLTMWRYIHSIIELVNKHLKTEWNNKLANHSH